MANTINFFQDRNFYHTLKTANEKEAGGMIHGDAVITGGTPETINKDDILSINGVNYVVQDVTPFKSQGCV